MSTAPHLWRILLETQRSGARLVVVDPFRSKTARLADEHLTAAAGHGRGAGARDDARDPRRRARGRGLVPRLRHRAGRAARSARRMAARPRRRGDRRARHRHRAGRARLRPYAARAASTRRRGPAPPRRTGRLQHGRFAARAGRSRGATAAAAAPTSRPRPPPRSRRFPAGGPTCGRSRFAASTCPSSETRCAATSTRRWRRSSCGTRTRRRSRPTRRRCSRGSSAPDLFTVVLEQFMTDTAAHADVVLPATTQLEHLDVIFSWGHHYITLSRPAIEPLGEAKPNTEIFRLLAARLGLDDPCFRRLRRAARRDRSRHGPGSGLA